MSTCKLPSLLKSVYQNSNAYNGNYFISETISKYLWKPFVNTEL